MKTCNRAIYQLLHTLASGNVFAGRAPKNQQPPFIVYQKPSGNRWRSINGPSGIAQVSMRVDFYEKDYNAATDLAAAGEEILDGFSGTVYYGSASPQDFLKIGGISLQNETDFLDQTDEPILNRVSATYLVTYTQ